MKTERRNFRRLMAAFALVAISGIEARGSDIEDTYLKFSEVVCSSNLNPKSDECYQQVVRNFARVLGDSTPEFKIKEYGTGGDKNGYSSYQLKPKRQRKVTVTIHGLWGDSTQFEQTLDSANRGFAVYQGNVIELTLPGHLKTVQDPAYTNEIKKNPPFASYDKWLVALDETLKVAALLGDDVTVVGQSTGGLLAAYAAYKYPAIVKNVVLVEPALKVNPLMNFGSCTLGAALTKSPVVRAIAKIFRDVPNGVNVKMGCEVQRLATSVLKPLSSTSVKEAKYSDAIRSLAMQTRQPVFLVNNEHDKVVSAEMNRIYYAALPGKKFYQSINLDGKSPHGAVTQTNPEALALAVDEIDFATHPQNPDVKAAYGSALQDFLRASVQRLTGYGHVDLSRFTSFDFERRLCEFVSSSDCEVVRDGVRELKSVIQAGTNYNAAPEQKSLEIISKLKPACNELDQLGKLVWAPDVFNPACRI